MRSDHKHLITDSYEGGKFLKEPKGYIRDMQRMGDDLPYRESMSKKWDDWDGRTAYRGAPLRRFIESQIGRPWDNVWSEICQHNDHRNTNGRLVRESVDWSVMGVGFRRDYSIVEGEDGKVFYVSRHGWMWKSDGLVELSPGDIYKSPSTGLLCKYKPDGRKRRRGNYLDVGVVWAGKPAEPGVQYRRIGNEWFEVVLRKADWTLVESEWMDSRLVKFDAAGFGVYELVKRKKKVYPAYFDVVTNKWQKEPPKYRYGAEHVMLYNHLNLYAFSKRQLSGREIKRLGLREKLEAQKASRVTELSRKEFGQLRRLGRLDRVSRPESKGFVNRKSA